MNTTIQVLPHVDALMEEYNSLAFIHEIPDMQAYATDWQRLGNEAAKQDRPALAEMCYSRAKHYSEIDGGHYYRIVDGCLAELQRIRNPMETDEHFIRRHELISKQTNDTAAHRTERSAA